MVSLRRNFWLIYPKATALSSGFPKAAPQTFPVAQGAHENPGANAYRIPKRANLTITSSVLSTGGDANQPQKLGYCLYHVIPYLKLSIMFNQEPGHLFP